MEKSGLQGVQRVPLAPGPKGWGGPKPPRVPEGSRFQARHALLPSMIRAHAAVDHSNFPALTEGEVVQAVRVLSKPDYKRRCHTTLREAPDGQASTQALLDYLKKDNTLSRWWPRCPWRAKGTFRDQVYENLLGQYFDGAHIQIWELAHFRIPRTLLYDEDVLFAQCYIQGMDHVMAASTFNLENPQLIPIVVSGLRKLFSNPHFRFCLVAPHMPQFGVTINGALFSETVLRMELLLENPLAATTGELEEIERSPAYRAGWATMNKRRKKQSRKQAYVNPPGPWYYCGVNGRPIQEELREWLIWEEAHQRRDLEGKNVKSQH
jgi:hypothetical protein